MQQSNMNWRDRMIEELEKNSWYLRIGLIILLALIVYLGTAKATDITDCANLTNANDVYYLTANISIDMWDSISGIPNCMNISANNVTLDCQGNIIYQNTSPSIYGSGIGIWVYRNSIESTNITIQNCTIINFGTGIYFANADNNTIDSIIAYNNTAYTGCPSIYGSGIKLENSSYNKLTNIIAEYNELACAASGIDLINSNYTLLENVIADFNINDGIYLENSYYNNLTHITAESNDNAGIHLRNSDNNILNSSIADNNFQGIELESSANNLIYNNFLNNSYNTYVDDDSYTNNWNVTQQSGSRIYSNGSEIGGNYYVGYSDSCLDINHDGFCDSPYDNYAETNCTLGVNCGNNTDYLPLAAFSNSTPLVYNCSEGSPNSLTFGTYDEDINASIIGNQSMAFYVYYTNSSFVNAFSFEFLNVYNATICFNLATEYINSIHQYYSEPDYPMRTYYLNHAVINNTNGQLIPLYLSKQAKLTFITLLDGYGNGAPNDYIFANRYFPSTNSYTTTDIVLTDAFGNATTYLLPNTVFYQFVVVGSNGQLLNSFSRMTVACDSNATACHILLRLPLNTLPEYWNYWGRIAYHCNVNETNKPDNVTIACTTVDTSGLLHQVNLNTWLVNLFSSDILCNQSTSAPSSQLFCTIYNVTGNIYTYQLAGTFNDTVVLIQDTLDYRIRQLFGLYGLLPSLLIILSLSLLGAAISPSAVIIGGVLGAASSSIMGLLDLTTSSIVALVVVSLLVVYKLRS